MALSRDDAEVIGSRLKEVMKEQELTAERLASETQLSEATISGVINGDPKAITRAVAKKISEVVGEPLDQMTNGVVRVSWNSKWDDALNSDARQIIASVAKASVEGATGGITGVVSNIVDVYKEITGSGPGKLAWVLLSRSMCSAIGELSGPIRGEDDQVFADKPEFKDFLAVMATDVQASLQDSNLVVDRGFFRQPKTEFTRRVGEKLVHRLQESGVLTNQANSINRRLNYYFASAYAAEYRHNAARYASLQQAVGPMDDVIEQHRQWLVYDRYLDRLPHEPVLGESFGLDEGIAQLGRVDVCTPLVHVP